MNFWWPGMHQEVAECVRTCPVCQKDRPRKVTPEVLRWIDKGEAPFAGWSIDAAGPFAADEDGNRYLLVAIDPFSKWVEAVPTPSLNSWRAADFLYQRIITCWGKPRFIRTDNGSEFSGSLRRLCESLKIQHFRITVGNSKANG
jgi:transposase InsO family protein